MYRLRYLEPDSAQSTPIAQSITGPLFKCVLILELGTIMCEKDIARTELIRVNLGLIVAR